jgi:predicted RNA-binding Zn-ribbon protein involved in translation (DUF1610 family)
MRIVDCLEKVIICPNCGANRLMKVSDGKNLTNFKYCPNCGESIYEGDSPLSIASTSNDTLISHQNIKEREELLIEARDLLHDLPLFARTANELASLNQITNIFDKILTLLEKE